MSTTIDFRTMPANVPSLCIPRVFPNIDERRIRGIIDSLNMGEIGRVDIIRKQTDKGEKFNRVFIHWKRWNDSENANKSRERLLNGKEIKIIYDDPWFWKISAYREPAANTSRPQARPLAANPRLEFDSDDDKKRENRPYQKRENNRTRPQQQRDYRRSQCVERKTIQPSTPNGSPPRERDSGIAENEEREQMSEHLPDPVKLDYSGAPPPSKKLIFQTKKPVVIEE